MSCLTLLVVKPANAQTSTYPVIIASPTPTPYTQATPAPTPTSNIALSYNEVSRMVIDNDTKIVLAINAHRNFGGNVTLNYADFVLQILTDRGGLTPEDTLMQTGHAKPAETENVNVSINNSEVNFELTFTFPTIQNSFGGQWAFRTYQLTYTGNEIFTSWLTPTPSPSVPELSWLIILPLLLVAALPLVVIKLFSERQNRLRHEKWH